jgi:hypothetical protein
MTKKNARYILERKKKYHISTKQPRFLTVVRLLKRFTELAKRLQKMATKLEGRPISAAKSEREQHG